MSTLSLSAAELKLIVYSSLMLFNHHIMRKVHADPEKIFSYGGSELSNVWITVFSEVFFKVCKP